MGSPGAHVGSKLGSTKGLTLCAKNSMPLQLIYRVPGVWSSFENIDLETS